MHNPLPFRTLHWVLCGPAVALLAACVGPSASSTTSGPGAVGDESRAALLSLDYSGSQKALERLDREIAAAGRDPAKVAEIVAGLVQMLKEPRMTFAAEQAACQRLGRLLTSRTADEATLNVLAPMLADARLVNVARLALEPVPGPSVDALFLRSVAETKGATRLALIQSVGNRRIAAAVPNLAMFLGDQDEATARAAATALGRIGTPAALSGLNAAPSPASRTVVEAKLTCATQLPGADGTDALHAILGDPRVAEAQRAAAWRELLDREPADAAERIAGVLAANDNAFRQVALGAIAAVPSKDLVPLLAGKLASYDAPTQAALVAALARRGDVAAVPAVLAATGHAEAAVRAAALAALGILPGNAEVATRLARVAAEVKGDEAKLARQSLARLAGPGVNEAVVTGAEQAETGPRRVFLEEIGLRNMTEALPLLLKTRLDSDASLRAVALRALGDIAPASHQAEILAWAIDAKDSNEVARALHALISVSNRNLDDVSRDRPVVDAVDHGAPFVQLRLLPVLLRIGGADALACAGRMSLGPQADVASSATAILAQWPNRAALPVLVDTAERSRFSGVRAAAVDGAIGAIELYRRRPSAEPSDLVARLLAASRDIEVRKHLVFLLGRGSSTSALALANSLRDDPALANEARDAAMAIRANQFWPPMLTTSSTSDQRNNMVDGDLQTAWSAPATANQWIHVDTGRTRPMRRITLDQTGHAGDYPAHYEVYVTDDLAKPGLPFATGAGQSDKTVIELPAGTRGRYIIIEDTSKLDWGSWSVSELQVD